MSPQKRLILATCVSVLFMFFYSFVMVKPEKIKEEKNLTKVQREIPQEKEIPNIVQTNAQEDINNINLNENLISIIRSKNFDIKIDDLGRISSFKLKGEKYKNDHSSGLEIINKKLPKPLELRFENTKINKEAFTNSYTSSKENIILNDKAVELVLEQKLSNLKIRKILNIKPDGSYNVKIQIDKDIKFFISPGYTPDVENYQMTVEGVLVEGKDGKQTIIELGDAEQTLSFSNIKIASTFNRYYISLFYSKMSKLNVLISADKEENPVLFIQGQKDLELDAYIGAKEYDKLKNIQTFLTSAVEYGFFTMIAKPLFNILNIIHSYVGNWGWAIVIITIFIRIILYPLTYKGMVSMQKLKDLAPKMKEIQAKHKGNPTQMNQKMMELYKKNGANPMGGCLPLLLQIPIFFAIYRVLLNSIELKGADWIFWVQDLSLKDPYYVLPILMGLSMFFQQKLSPNNFSDPMQEKLFKFLPLIFTFFFLTFPAGLTLYWFVNNLLSILQQLIVNKQLEKMKDLKGKVDVKN